MHQMSTMDHIEKQQKEHEKYNNIWETFIRLMCTASSWHWRSNPGQLLHPKTYAEGNW